MQVENISEKFSIKIKATFIKSNFSLSSMEGVVFFDIDTQHDYMSSSYASYILGAESIIPNLEKITRFAKENKVRVIASVDKNKQKFSDFKNKKIKETMLWNFTAVKNEDMQNNADELLNSNIIVEKDSYSVFQNSNLKFLISGTRKAYVYGVATEFCVKAAVVGLLESGIETHIIVDAIKGVSIEDEKNTMEFLKSRGAKFLTTEQLLSTQSF